MVAAGMIGIAGSGCIVVGHHHDDDQWRPPEQWEDTAQLPPEEPARVYLLQPPQGSPGDTLIASLTADPPAPYGEIVDVEFLDGIVTCASQARENELLLTLSVLDDAAGGPVDAVIEYADGTAEVAEDLFNVVGGGPGSDGEPTEDTGTVDDPPTDGGSGSSGDDGAGDGVCGS
jgi:hypothetical protein